MSSKKAKAAKAKEEEEAAAQLRLQELKLMRTNYTNKCKQFISEPLPALIKRLDKAVQSGEDADKTLMCRELDFSCNSLGDEGLVPIAKALANNSTLKVLNLAANHIMDSENLVVGPSGLTPIALLCTALGSETSGLTKLDLRGNHIGEKGGKSIYDMLKVRKPLASSKKMPPLEVEVTERMSGDLFQQLMDLNDEMDAIAAKNNKKAGGKKGKKK
ncbi:hypothetical protein HDV05_005861 [Chytridiales sp. JEL 0842]|nr:hypothetical protein HDV05_005861 [Chytridiales sp. JEL 0842]